MIKIGSAVIKQQTNFWNNCLFHPTDAIEDAWGKKILDRMAEDRAVNTVRIYTMFEDIVYLDENGELAYDFRLNDLRLDYLVEKGYNLLLAYAAMPECIATNKHAATSNSKNKTRYKGKLFNTSAPTDYKLWEEICYEYTRHIVERYGEDTVSKWHLQCFNEPDIPEFFLSDLPREAIETRAEEYTKLYTAFANGICHVSEKLCFGGPALAYITKFLEIFLNNVKEQNIRLDYIAYHNYAGTSPYTLLAPDGSFMVENWVKQQEHTMETIKKCGFEDTELIADEWGMSSCGFYNIEECPAFIARETEVYSAYFVKLIYTILEKGWNISKMMICLSGQHEMVTDFSGFRNFFTMNFFAKPIYNAHVLSGKLHKGLLSASCDNKNVYVIPTKNEKDDYAVFLTYCSEKFHEDLPDITEKIAFPEDAIGKTATIYCIDKEHNNPYRLYERKGYTPDLTEEQIKILKAEGNLSVYARVPVTETLELPLTANAVYLIETED